MFNSVLACVSQRTWTNTVCYTDESFYLSTNSVNGDVTRIDPRNIKIAKTVNAPRQILLC